MNDEKPAHQRPELPDFWDKRYREDRMPWDAGGVPQALHAFAAAQAAPLTTLIPGCGSGYELEFLCDLGWPATAIDFSQAAVERARRVLPRHGARVEYADFFAWMPPAPLGLIYERAFLCALPRRLWDDYAKRCAQLLPPAAMLAGFFYLGEAGGGPPFAIEPAALDALLAPWFERIDDRAVEDSIAVFRGKERWQVWRRR